MTGPFPLFRSLQRYPSRFHLLAGASPLGRRARTVLIEDSAIIDCPASRVWAFISNPMNIPKWYDGEAEVRQTSTAPLAVGTTHESVVRFRGRRVALGVRCAELRPGEELAWKYITGPTRGSRDRWHLDDLDGRSTRLTRSFELRAGGAWKILQPLIARGARQAHRTEMAKIKRILENVRQAEA